MIVPLFSLPTPHHNRHREEKNPSPVFGNSLRLYHRHSFTITITMHNDLVIEWKGDEMLRMPFIFGYCATHQNIFILLLLFFSIPTVPVVTATSPSALAKKVNIYIALLLLPQHQLLCPSISPSSVAS
jgi:hypothetical protein